MTLAEFLMQRFDETLSLAALVGSDVDNEDVEEETEEGVRNLVRFVLADCEAKRRIVELHAQSTENLNYSTSSPFGAHTSCAVCVDFHADMDCENEIWPCRTLRALAQPYADHPDFRDEWRL